MPQATTLKPGQIRHLLRVTQATSRHPERDCLVLLLGGHMRNAGVRNSSNRSAGRFVCRVWCDKARSQFESITRGCRQRCIYLAHQLTVDAVEMYLAYRIECGLGTELADSRYRGLSPTTKLILTHKGSKFYLNTKRRINYSGEQVDYLACDSLQVRITKLYKNAGIRHGSSHSGRRSITSNLLANGHDLETVQLLLGHAELDHVMPNLEVSQKKLCEMFSDVI